MQLPIDIFALFGKVMYNLYSYFFNGPKIDLSLEFENSSREHLGASNLSKLEQPTSINNRS